VKNQISPRRSRRLARPAVAAVETSPVCPARPDRGWYSVDASRNPRPPCGMPSLPQVKTFYGLRSSRGYHGQGRALHCIICDSTVGWDIAHGVGANAKSLGRARSSTGSMSGPCSGVRRAGAPCWTAVRNHMDHVQVSVRGNSGHRLVGSFGQSLTPQFPIHEGGG
jgi:hypothetical protein